MKRRKAIGVTVVGVIGLVAISGAVINVVKTYVAPLNTGEIRVALHRDQARQIVLQVSDNGVGIPPEVDVRQAGTLGLQLVTTLTEQVGGTLELQREGGTTFTLTCPLEADGQGRG